MALTLWRWVALAAIGCAGVGVVIMNQSARRPVVQEDEVTRWQLYRAALRANSMAGVAASRLRALELGDSVARVLARSPAPDSSRWIVSPGLPAGLTNPLAALRVRVAQYRPRSARHPVDVVFTLDTVTVVRGAARSGNDLMTIEYLLPQQPGDRCVVLARISPVFGRNLTFYERREQRQLAADFTAQRLLGPCGFYEWFGPPGAQVDAWLRAGAWAYGYQSGGWERATRRFNPGRRWWWTGAFGAGAAGWPVRSYVSSQGYRCLSGDGSVCEAMVLGRGAHMRPPAVNPVWAPNTVTAGPYLDFFYQERGRFPLGPMETALLGYFVHTIGEERFSRFWSSDDPPEAAFQSATGRRLGDVLAEWARQVYGEYERGPGVGLMAGGSSLVLVGLGIAFAARAARRRQVA
jgi:hypothetical protein